VRGGSLVSLAARISHPTCLAFTPRRPILVPAAARRTYKQPETSWTFSLHASRYWIANDGYVEAIAWADRSGVALNDAETA